MSVKSMISNTTIKIFIVFIIFSIMIFSSSCTETKVAHQENSNIEDTSTLSVENNETPEIEGSDETTDSKTSYEQEKETSENGTEKEEGISINYENNFTLISTDGNKIALSDFAGKIVVLNFWATWCPPCKAEIPDFVEVYADFKDKNVSFFGVSLDDDINALKQFIFDFDIDYPIAIDNQIANVAGVWGISAIPTTFFIDIDGKVLDKWVGQIPKKELETILNGYLK